MDATNTVNIPKPVPVIRSPASIPHSNPVIDYNEPQPSSSSRPDDEIPITTSTTNTHILEVAAMLLFFSWNLTSTVFQNQILYQSCTTLLSFNVTTCEVLINDLIPDNLVPQEEQLEKVASRIFMCRGVLESIVPALISFLIGPWSDKFGRKPVLLSAFFGYFLAYFILTLISLISSASPWYYLLAFIPLSMLGGLCVVISALYCYISDVSCERDRAFRMARMEAAVFIGLLLGTLISGSLYEISSATVVFGFATVCTLAGLVVIYVFLKESIKNETDITGFWGKFKALFDRKHVADLYRTCVKRRDNNGRALIWLIICALILTMFIMDGSVILSYLFMRDKFKWMITDYNMYSASNVVCQVFGNIFGTYVLNKMFSVPEIVIAIIAYVSSMIEYIIVGLASYSWQLYVASIIVMLKGVAQPMCRSYLAYLVPSNEIGKIYSVATSMESLAPILAAPIYTWIYDATIDTYPGAFNFFSAFLYLCCIMLTLTAYIVRRRQSNNYQQMIS